MIEGSCHCGAVRWTLDALPVSATACNCTVCRRYGTLWAYGHHGEDVHVSGETRVYVRADSGDLGFHACAVCGCVAYWRATPALRSQPERMGVNLRLAEPDAVADIPIHHLDGLETWRVLPDDGQRVKDLWF